MDIADQTKANDGITCGQCGKKNGNGQIGTSWICADCKVSEDVKQPEQIETVDND